LQIPNLQFSPPITGSRPSIQDDSSGSMMSPQGSFPSSSASDCKNRNDEESLSRLEGNNDYGIVEERKLSSFKPKEPQKRGILGEKDMNSDIPKNLSPLSQKQQNYKEYNTYNIPNGTSFSHDKTRNIPSENSRLEKISPEKPIKIEFSPDKHDISIQVSEHLEDQTNNKVEQESSENAIVSGLPQTIGLSQSSLGEIPKSQDKETTEYYPTHDNKEEKKSEPKESEHSADTDMSSIAQEEDNSSLDKVP